MTVIRILLVMVFSGFILSAAIADVPPPHLSLMPLPASVQLGDGQLLITQKFTVGIAGYKEARLERAGGDSSRICRDERACRSRWRQAIGTTATLVIHADHASRAVQELDEDESYTLEVTSRGAKLTRKIRLAFCGDCKLSCSSWGLRQTVSRHQP